MEDTYKIPVGTAEGFYKEKGSKFHSYAYAVWSVEEVEEKLEEIKKLHPKARHICYAYRLRPVDQQFRVNDDGEPSGTAGKPIFNQIMSAELHVILVGVVRYFGGTKLGASGLIRAYKTAAEDAIQQLETVEKYDTLPYQINFEYGMMGDLMNVLKQLKIKQMDKQFNLKPHLIVEFRKSTYLRQINKIKAHFLGRDIEDIEEDTEVEGLEFLDIEIE
jgi:uncharacterized YigZ family protein